MTTKVSLSVALGVYIYVYIKVGLAADKWVLYYRVFGLRLSSSYSGNGGTNCTVEKMEGSLDNTGRKTSLGRNRKE